MNGTEINWLSDALLIIGGTFAFIIAFVVVAACRLSGLISQDEEARENRAAFDRINRAA